MDFGLSADQQALSSAAQELLARRCGTDIVRAVVETGKGLDHELWADVRAQGWPFVALAEAHGGLGLGLVELALLAEQVGRYVAPVPVLSTALSVRALERSGQAETLARLVSNGVAASGRTGGPVIDLPIAEWAVTVGDDEVSLYHLEPPGPEPDSCLDPTRVIGRLDAGWSGLEIGGPELVGELSDWAAVLYSASIVGACDRVLDMTVEYAKVREQFGRPIGSFQAIKHRCADMFVDLEGMRSATYYAAWSVAQTTDDASLAASSAKAWCAGAGPRLMASALQVHGGIGFTWEHDLHLYLKRVEVDARLFGDEGWHHDRIASLLSHREHALIGAG